MLALFTPDRDKQCQRLTGETICQGFELGNKTVFPMTLDCGRRGKEKKNRLTRTVKCRRTWSSPEN